VKNIQKHKSFVKQENIYQKIEEISYGKMGLFQNGNVHDEFNLLNCINEEIDNSLNPSTNHKSKSSNSPNNSKSNVENNNPNPQESYVQAQNDIVQNQFEIPGIPNFNNQNPSINFEKINFKENIPNQNHNTQRQKENCQNSNNLNENSPFVQNQSNLDINQSLKVKINCGDNKNMNQKKAKHKPSYRRKHNKDNLIKKIYSRIMKYFPIYFNKKYGRTKKKNEKLINQISNLPRLKRNGQVCFRSIREFEKLIKNEKMLNLLSKDISHKYKCNKDFNKNSIELIKDDKKILFELTFDEVCQYLSRYKINPQDFEDEKYKYLRGFEKYTEKKIFEKMDSEEKKLCLELMSNHFRFVKRTSQKIIFKVEK
jgi:hypothetical protein